MSLEYRRYSKASWSGDARHPMNRFSSQFSAAPEGLANVSRWHSKLRHRETFPDFCCIMTVSGPVFKMPGTCQPVPGLPGRCVARRPDFFAENPALVPTSARNPPPFTLVHAYAGASESSGAFSGVPGGESCVFRAAGRRNALSAFLRGAQQMLW